MNKINKLKKIFQVRNPAAEQGMGIIELLIAVALIGLIAAGISSNTTMSLRISKYTELNYAASNLALSRIELLSAIEPADVDSDYNKTETGLTTNGVGIKFTRVTTVTVNSDDSRTINVVVSNSDYKIPVRVEYETTFSVWE